MFECLILGDSIAVGIGQAITECRTIARSGISSSKWLEQFRYNPFYRDTIFRVAVISLSTNDLTYENTEDNLYQLRKGLRADAVVWILPNRILKPTQKAIIEQLASVFSDKILDISENVGPDTIHPPNLTEYRKIGNKIKDLTNK
jgi:hypothetical protein